MAVDRCMLQQNTVTSCPVLSLRLRMSSAQLLCSAHSLTHSITHSLPHSLTHSLTHCVSTYGCFASQDILLLSTGFGFATLLSALQTLQTALPCTCTFHKLYRYLVLMVVLVVLRMCVHACRTDDVNFSQKRCLLCVVLRVLTFVQSY